MLRQVVDKELNTMVQENDAIPPASNHSTNPTKKTKKTYFLDFTLRTIYLNCKDKKTIKEVSLKEGAHPNTLTTHLKRIYGINGEKLKSMSLTEFNNNFGLIADISGREYEANKRNNNALQNISTKNNFERINKSILSSFENNNLNNTLLAPMQSKYTKYKVKKPAVIKFVEGSIAIKPSLNKFTLREIYHQCQNSALPTVAQKLGCDQAYLKDYLSSQYQTSPLALKLMSVEAFNARYSLIADLSGREFEIEERFKLTSNNIQNSTSHISQDIQLFNGNNNHDIRNNPSSCKAPQVIYDNDWKEYQLEDIYEDTDPHEIVADNANKRKKPFYLDDFTLREIYRYCYKRSQRQAAKLLDINPTSLRNYLRSLYGINYADFNQMSDDMFNTTYNQIADLTGQQLRTQKKNASNNIQSPNGFEGNNSSNRNIPEFNVTPGFTLTDTSSLQVIEPIVPSANEVDTERNEVATSNSTPEIHQMLTLDAIIENSIAEFNEGTSSLTSKDQITMEQPSALPFLEFTPPLLSTESNSTSTFQATTNEDNIFLDSDDDIREASVTKDDVFNLFNHHAALFFNDNDSQANHTEYTINSFKKT